MHKAWRETRGVWVFKKRTSPPPPPQEDTQYNIATSASHNYRVFFACRIKPMTCLTPNWLTTKVKPLLSGLLLSGHFPQPGSWFSLFYADVAEIVGNTVGVAYYSLCAEIQTNLSNRHPLIPRRLDKRAFIVFGQSQYLYSMQHRWSSRL